MTALRVLRPSQGVVVEERIEGVNEEGAKKPRYPVPDVSKHAVASHLSFGAPEMVAQTLN